MHKKLLTFFLLFGITTINYAENFYIKHEYTQVFKTFDPPMSIWYDKIAISNDDYIITDRLSDISRIESDVFGVYKTPLTIEMKKRMVEINKLFRLPHIEEILATSNKQRDFIYVLDMNNTEMKQIEMIKMISGLEVTSDWDLDKFLKYGNRSQAKNHEKISQFIIDLIDNGISKNKVKFADFYGTTNILPKNNGLEVTLTLKNIGPFDVTITNPKEWGEIPKVGEDVNTDHFWYEIIFGGLYKDISWTTRFGLEGKYLIKDEFQSEKALQGYFVIKSNSVRVVRFLIPYKEIKFRSNTGEIDGNRTKQGYVLLDYQAGVLDSSWNLDIYFGNLFSDRTWKEEKTSLVKGWVNLE